MKIATFAYSKVNYIMSKLKAALFDLDGVVFDTEPQYTEFWGEQCREFHPEWPGLEKEIKGQTLTQIFERHFSGELLPKRELITKRLNEFERDMCFRYVEGFEAFIADLHAHDVRTAVVTSSNVPKMRSVYTGHPEFRALFDAILTAEDFTLSKPAPECYLTAAERFCIEPHECIVFEDSFNGLKSGRAACMTVVGLATTNAPELIAPYSAYVVGDFRELDYNICEKLISGKFFNKQ